MVRSGSLNRHKDEVFGPTRLSSPNQVSVALPVHSLRAGWGDPSKSLDRRDDGLSLCHRPFDGTCVLHVTRHDLDEIASQKLGSGRIPAQDSHLESPRRQQTHDLAAEGSSTTSDQDH
jgi:hypothetical protein